MDQTDHHYQNQESDESIQLAVSGNNVYVTWGDGTPGNNDLATMISLL